MRNPQVPLRRIVGTIERRFLSRLAEVLTHIATLPARDAVMADRGQSPNLAR